MVKVLGGVGGKNTLFRVCSVCRVLAEEYVKKNWRFLIVSVLHPFLCKAVKGVQGRNIILIPEKNEKMAKK